MLLNKGCIADEKVVQFVFKYMILVPSTLPLIGGAQYVKSLKLIFLKDLPKKWF